MIAEYRILYDQRYIAQATQRYRRQHGSRWLQLPLTAIAVAGLGAFIYMFLSMRLIAPTLTFFILLILLLTSARLSAWWVAWQMRKSPLLGTEFTIQVSEEGFVGTNPHLQSQASWTIYSKCRRHPDGFLLLGQPLTFQWWPDAALRYGTVADVAAVLRARIANYSEIRRAP